MGSCSSLSTQEKEQKKKALFDTKFTFIELNTDTLAIIVCNWVYKYNLVDVFPNSIVELLIQFACPSFYQTLISKLIQVGHLIDVYHNQEQEYWIQNNIIDEKMKQMCVEVKEVLLSQPPLLNINVEGQ